MLRDIHTWQVHVNITRMCLHFYCYTGLAGFESAGLHGFADTQHAGDGS